jgi:hypothetical protein
MTASVPFGGRKEGVLQTIRYVKKSMALKDGDNADPSMIFILAYSCYYSSFLGIGELNSFCPG